jgi:CBS-domain-containing membrane protein
MRGPLVSDLMSRPVVSAGPEASFKELVALLAEHAIAAIPVVDEHRRPIGLVGEADLLARHGRDARQERGVRWLRVWTKAQGLTARELMSTIGELGTFLAREAAAAVPAVAPNGEAVVPVAR